MILDSSAVVAAEREGMNARGLLQAMEARFGNDDIAVSVITVMELVHGVVRANTPERRNTRQRFLDELMSVLQLRDVTAGVALCAGRIDGISQSNGVRIPLSDLLIGATALDLGYSVVTHNVRHFGLIPDLEIRAL